MAPMKLAEAYNSFTKTIGVWLTKTSRSIPPPIPVNIPDKTITRKFIPNKLYAKVAPITVKTPKPIASNLRKRFQCLRILEYNKNNTIAVDTVIITYAGSINEFGNSLQNIIYLIVIKYLLLFY